MQGTQMNKRSYQSTEVANPATRTMTCGQLNVHECCLLCVSSGCVSPLLHNLDMNRFYTLADYRDQWTR